MQDIAEKIKELKKQKNAIILAHFYQAEDIQKIADVTGDSLELSKAAKASDSDIIVFCGVRFMAESAKVLNPEKTVLLPNRYAGCPMADMIKPEDVIKLRKQYPNAPVVTYINSSVEVKAVSDICCTSSNAVKVVNSLPDKEIIFVPDRNLGSYVARFTDKTVHLFDGYCHVHDKVTALDVKNARKAHPNAEVLVHPECRPEVVDNADFVGSTAKIIEYATKSDKEEFIIGTEKGILYQLRLKNPGKKFYILSENMFCPNMKKTTLDDVLCALENEEYEIEPGDSMIEKASACLYKMLKL